MSLGGVDRSLVVRHGLSYDESVNDPVEAALDKLRVEHAAAAARVAELKTEFDDASAQLQRLYDAVTSLQRLVEPDPPSFPLTIERVTLSHNDFRLAEAPTGEEIPEVLKKYLPRGGDGKRLRSTLMVADVAGMTRDIVTREELRDRFFQHFGYDLLSKYWEKPDNAFGNAFARAVREGSILEVPNSGGGESRFGGGFVDRKTGIPAMHSGEEDD